MSSLAWLAQPGAFPWVALAFGLCIGSFLNVVIHRLPRMMEREWKAQCAELAGKAPPVGGPESPPYNLFRPRSACPGCGHRIRAWENIPLVSWLALRGRCSACGTRISARYPLVELLAGLGAAYAAWRFGPTLAAAAAALFVWFTIALAFIDQQTGYLPDDLTLPLVWIGLLANLGGAFVPLADAVIGAAAAYLFLWSVNAAFRLARGMDGMGYGDFKLYAAVGAFLGWKFLPLVILLSSLVGLVFGSLQMFSARRGWDWKFKFHFGPYLALAGVIAMFWGPAIMQRYPALRFAG
jgi:leader peptidase (prepilin peptidase) / N-methyltransferase